jgi:UDP-glucose 4-epimerase
VKILVTGGAGFVGSHSVDRLLRAQFPVRVLDNFSTGRPEHLTQQSGLEVQIGDIRSIDDVNRAMRGVSHVLHLAGQASERESIEHPVTSCSHNVRGFVNVIEAARRAGVQRFVYASAWSVYGGASAFPVDETTAPRPLTPYALEKSIDDQYAAMYRDLYGLHCLGLRYFSVYGTRQEASSPDAGVIARWVDRVNRGLPVPVFGDGSATRDFVHVSDVAEVNLRALSSGCQGVLNVGTGRSRSIAELLETLVRAAGRPLALERLPERSGDIRRAATKVDLMARELGYVPATTLEEGLAELVAGGSALAA